MKVLLILSDGMRPDSLAGIEAAEEIKKESTYCLNAKTVFPPVTLPCHMSLFHSVDPSRHGTVTNIYVPQVRPVSGLCEQLRLQGKKSAFFYNWGELRDLARPDSLAVSEFYSGRMNGYFESNKYLCGRAREQLTGHDMDFVFLYLGWTDSVGHDYGWMSSEYLSSVRNTFDMIKGLVDTLRDRYLIIITSDHGGHDRTHGIDIPEDMHIPIFLCGGPYEKNREINNLSIKDLAPTIAWLLGADAAPEWEGKVIRP